MERVAACSVHPAAGGGLGVQLMLEGSALPVTASNVSGTNPFLPGEEAAYQLSGRAELLSLQAALAEAAAGAAAPNAPASPRAAHGLELRAAAGAAWRKTVLMGWAPNLQELLRTQGIGHAVQPEVQPTVRRQVELGVPPPPPKEHPQTSQAPLQAQHGRLEQHNAAFWSALSRIKTLVDSQQQAHAAQQEQGAASGGQQAQATQQEAPVQEAVSGLDGRSVTLRQLEAYFRARYASATSATAPGGGEPSSIAWVGFLSSEERDRAAREMNGHVLPGVQRVAEVQWQQAPHMAHVELQGARPLTRP
ncbi:hypothetical protein ABPG77_007289 [Micractinium sp. CCAP 211/92]